MHCSNMFVLQPTSVNNHNLPMDDNSVKRNTLVSHMKHTIPSSCCCNLKWNGYHSPPLPQNPVRMFEFPLNKLWEMKTIWFSDLLLIQSEPGCKDGDKGLEGLLSTLLLPGLGRESLHDDTIGRVFVVAGYCTADLRTCLLLHHDRYHIFVWLVQGH